MRKSILSNSKKGSLSLSMNAIVVVVLAFAMLGLGLTITNLIFKSIDIPDIPKPGQEATAENPIAISNEIKVKSKSIVNLPFDYYNRLDDTAEQAIPVISTCIDENGKELTEVPSFAVLPQDVDSGTNFDFVGRFSLKGKVEYKGGQTYVCSLQIVNADTLDDTGKYVEDDLDTDDDEETDAYETKTIYLQVTS